MLRSCFASIHLKGSLTAAARARASAAAAGFAVRPNVSMASSTSTSSSSAAAASSSAATGSSTSSIHATARVLANSMTVSSVPRVVVRYTYPGCTQRNGLLVELSNAALGKLGWSRSSVECSRSEIAERAEADDVAQPQTAASLVHEALRLDGVDLSKWGVRVYDRALGGFTRLENPLDVQLTAATPFASETVSKALRDIPTEMWTPLDRKGRALATVDESTTIASGPPASRNESDPHCLRLEVSLFARPAPTPANTLTPERVVERVEASSADLVQDDSAVEAGNIAVPQPGTQDGYFGIGVYGAKTPENMGTLWRSAWQLGAAYCFVVGARFKKMAGDTTKTWRQIPMYQHKDWNDFAKARPYQADWVAVEMGGTPIEEFKHPKRAVYILGSEDNGISSSVLKACAHHVSLPTGAGRSPSFNVAVTGSLIMYDREMKRRKAEADALAAIAQRHAQRKKGRPNGTALKEIETGASAPRKRPIIDVEQDTTELRVDGDGGRCGVDSVKPKHLRPDR
eukprot:INCI15077.1.p1 GENE.INCI15077.1~~INCI15077.1.p1  ORF type:complete len:515 (+),score=84.22 INCI15077.1:380-1924(+)